MERIRNIVFDLGGVLIDLDHHQAMSRFEEIGVKDAKQLLDPYEQKGFFLEVENGKIDVDTFCRKLREHTGKQLSYDEIEDIAQRYDNRILEWVDAAYNSTDISMLDLDETYSIGYTLRTLSAALWCYWHSPSFEEGLLSVVNEGGDADTNGAIACAILGAKFGYTSFPSCYVENLHNQAIYHQKITAFINQAVNE